MVKEHFELVTDEEIQEMFLEHLDNPLRMVSETDPSFKKLRNSFLSRKKYIDKMGFSLFTREFLIELKTVMDQKNISEFVEVYAGYGTFTLFLNQLGLAGKGITFKPDGNWGLTPDNIILEKNLELKHIIFHDIANIHIANRDMIVASWIPYRGGQELITFYNNHPRDYFPYLLLVGEGYGGCTSSDEFFDFLDENFDEEYHFENFQRFDAIYDRCILYKKKDFYVN